ncbi:hypothetical protein SAMN05216552_10716 [Pseudoduganella namucuonensis]|uniref:Xyloglucanase n=2 Tax=Pseudoduganella namucuonensis TaxID=1035707 RepID=A0A1I7M6X8_9BURK|nr:hypothetical protein SAMN05216552_10716 [Pseudoduganella namucuonensis]
MRFSANTIAGRTALAAALLAASAFAALPAQVQAAGPTYSWSNVKIGGGGYITGMIAHPLQRGLFYNRTDVGGAYRYDAATSTWIPLHDWLPPEKSYLYGIDTIAIDPSNANKFYLVAGLGFLDGNAMFMSSQDQGRSFKQVPLPFSTGANAIGRQVGERLQVDPNLGNVLFYGTANAAVNASNNGLWKSTNGGDTWSKVAGFPALSSDGTGAGVAFLAFHKGSNWNKPPGSPTSIIYAAVNTQAAADSGATLYKSSDAGATWNRVWGAPNGMLPQRGQIGPDGYLYITFARFNTEYGPGGMDMGQVWKVNILTGADEWTNITPLGNSPKGYGFAGLSVDPAHPKTVAVNTLGWYDGLGVPLETMYYSTDGGATWTDIRANATVDTSAAPWSARPAGDPTSFGNSGGSLLDPFDPNHAFITSGGATWETKNLTQPKTNWAYGQNGIEESVPLSLISPVANEWNAYPLISGDGDFCGLTHTSVSVAPNTKFSSPTCKDTTSLDYAKTNSKIVVRVGTDNWGNPKHLGAVSWNGGYSWYPFGNNGPSPNGDGGRVAISGDGTTILWSTKGAPTVVSNDFGSSWTQVGVPQEAHVIADGYDTTTFYAYARDTGGFYASYNKGATWYLLSIDNNYTGPHLGLPAWGDMVSVPFGKKGDIWVSTYAGLYRNTNWGQANWTLLPGVQSAKGLGFGKAAPGASYPTMYLDGTINGVTGIYRSIDTGATWVRIDDPQHQYAKGGNDKSTIIGDPKTFGTVYLGKRGIMVGTSSN